MNIFIDYFSIKSRARLGLLARQRDLGMDGLPNYSSVASSTGTTTPPQTHHMELHSV